MVELQKRSNQNETQKICDYFLDFTLIENVKTTVLVRAPVTQMIIFNQGVLITPGFKPSSYSFILSLGCLGHLKLLIKVTDMTAKIDGNILMTMSRKTKARKSLIHLLV